MNDNGFPMDAVLVDVGSQNPTKPASFPRHNISKFGKV
jgi:hypothetical protein